MADFLRSKQTTHQYARDFLLGDLLLAAGVVNEKALDDAVRLAGNKHLHIGQMLIMSGAISARDLQAAVDAQSALRDQTMEFNDVCRCLKTACKSGLTFSDCVKNSRASTHDTQSNKLGGLLLEAGIVNQEQLVKGLQKSMATGLPLGRILVLNGSLADPILTLALDLQIRLRDGMIERKAAIEVLHSNAGLNRGDENSAKSFEAQLLLSNQPRKKGVRLGELLVMSGLLTEVDVMNALETGLTNDQPIGQILLEQGFATQELLDATLELQKQVDLGRMEVAEAADGLRRVYMEGISVTEILGRITGDFTSAQDKETVSIDRLIILSRLANEEQIDEAFNWRSKDAKTIARVLNVVGCIDEETMHALICCYEMLTKHWLNEDEAVVALDVYINKPTGGRGNFEDTLLELGWEGKDHLLAPELQVDLKKEKASKKDSKKKKQDNSEPNPEKLLQALSEAEKTTIGANTDVSPMVATEITVATISTLQKSSGLKNLLAAAQAPTVSVSTGGGLNKLLARNATPNPKSPSGSFRNLLSFGADLSKDQEEGKNDEKNLPVEFSLPIEKSELENNVDDAFNRLAESYYEQGNYPEAQTLYERILDMRERELGKKHILIVNDLNNLAAVYCAQNKFADAEPLVHRVVEIVEATQPLQVLTLADGLNTLAGIYFQFEKFQECEPLLVRAIELRRSEPEAQGTVADTLRDYAKLLRKLGREAEAEKYYKQAKETLAGQVKQNVTT